jgi:hypothetical protein
MEAKTMDKKLMNDFSDKYEMHKNNLLTDRIVDNIQSLIPQLETEGLMDRNDNQSMFLTDMVFASAMECCDLDYDELSEAVTTFVDHCHFPFRYYDESDNLMVGLYNFELSIGKSVKWHKYLNQCIDKQGKYLPGFELVWFFEDKEEWDHCKISLECGDTLPVSSIVDFPVMCVRWQDYLEPQPHIESICDILSENVLTRGNYLEGFVPVCTGDDNENCSLNFNKLLKTHPEKFKK